MKTTSKVLNFFKRAAVVFAIAVLTIFALPLGIVDYAVKAKAESVSNSTVKESAVNPGVRISAETVADEVIPDFLLTINYFNNKDADKWYLWLWSLAGEKIKDENKFSGSVNIGGKAWKTLSVGISGVKADKDGNAVGLIVRDAAWNKDVEIDRFVKADKIVNNKVTLYLVTGDSELYYSEEEAIVAMQNAILPKITSAAFSALDEVKIKTGVAITDKSYFKIKDSGNNVVGELDCSLPENVDYVGKTAITIKLNSNCDFSKSYVICDEPAVIDTEKNFSRANIVTHYLFEDASFDVYNYDGNDLGAVYSAEKTVFKVWSPYAEDLKLNIYSAGEGGTATSYDMVKSEKGTWSYTLNGDQKNKYYTYSVVNGGTTNEIVDPYAKSGGRNGQRGMIVDFNSADTKPQGWDTQSNPTLKSNAHAVIWEAQLRDVTIHESSGVSEANRGKFLGLTETGTKNSKGQATALDYLKELGVTQVHFQPLFDFASVVEDFKVATYNKDGQYNWGYDPLNYNMPEGSYSSDPSNGTVRVKEMREMVMALHNAGIQVIMDVVYNHVSNASTSNFEKLMPGYYFRKSDTGNFLNGSGCGNETASERFMFRKFMIDSLLHWTAEYKIDGFRFDLMGLHDVNTMNMIYDELVKVNPDVILYGEPWDAGSNGISGKNRPANKGNAKRMPNIAIFNDDFRDGIGGSFAQGSLRNDGAVYIGTNGWTEKYTANPLQSIAYTACHDNSTIWDKLNRKVDASKSVIKQMNNMSAVAVYTSQGISFMLAGEEMLRSKPTTRRNSYDNRPYSYASDPDYYFSDNSYKSPDSVNAINWELRDTNKDVVEFYKGLIAIKKTWPQFHLSTKEEIAQNVKIVDADLDDGVVSYAIKDPNSNEYAVILFNNGNITRKIAVPQGNYDVFVNGNKASATKLSSFSGNSFTVGARSAVVMRGTIDGANLSAWQYKVEDVKEADDSNLGLALGLGIGIPAAVLIAGGAVFGVMYGKKKKGKKDEASDKDEPKAGDKPDDGEAPAEKTEQEQAPAEEQPSTDKSEE